MKNLGKLFSFFVLGLLFSIATVSAATYYFAKPISLQIRDQALELKTVENINDWVESNINYTYYRYARGIDKTWKTREGDCTDKAMLKCRMLGYVNISCRLVRGYSYYDEVDYKEYKRTKWRKHDWFEYRVNHTWHTLEYQYFYRLDILGYGIW